MKPIEDCTYCDKVSVSMAYDEKEHGLVPVCRDHILVYRVGDSPNSKLRRPMWQAEDEWLDIRFARRSRWKWLAQAKLLHDQRAVLFGKQSLFQRYRTWKASR